jgi:hypothetical protein
MPKTGNVGALVQYCGHAGYFVADVLEVAGAAVVVTDPVNIGKLIRDDRYGPATHHLLDFPGPIVWKPDRGIFVVPKKNLRRL